MNSRPVSWVAVFDVFVVCHLVGDFLLQTDWQANHKYGGLGGDPVRAAGAGLACHHLHARLPAGAGLDRLRNWSSGGHCSPRW